MLYNSSDPSDFLRNAPRQIEEEGILAPDTRLDPDYQNRLDAFDARKDMQREKNQLRYDISGKEDDKPFTMGMFDSKEEWDELMEPRRDARRLQTEAMNRAGFETGEYEFNDRGGVATDANLLPHWQPPVDSLSESAESESEESKSEESEPEQEQAQAPVEDAGAVAEPPGAQQPAMSPEEESALRARFARANQVDMTSLEWRKPFAMAYGMNPGNRRDFRAAERKIGDRTYRAPSRFTGDMEEPSRLMGVDDLRAHVAARETAAQGPSDFFRAKEGYRGRPHRQQLIPRSYEYRSTPTDESRPVGPMKQLLPEEEYRAARTRSRSQEDNARNSTYAQEMGALRADLSAKQGGLERAQNRKIGFRWFDSFFGLSALGRWGKRAWDRRTRGRAASKAQAAVNAREDAESNTLAGVRNTRAAEDAAFSNVTAGTEARRNELANPAPRPESDPVFTDDLTGGRTTAGIRDDSHAPEVAAKVVAPFQNDITNRLQELREERAETPERFRPNLADSLLSLPHPDQDPRYRSIAETKADEANPSAYQDKVEAHAKRRLLGDIKKERGLEDSSSFEAARGRFREIKQQKMGLDDTLANREAAMGEPANDEARAALARTRKFHQGLKDQFGESEGVKDDLITYLTKKDERTEERRKATERARQAELVARKPSALGQDVGILDLPSQEVQQADELRIQKEQFEPGFGRNVQSSNENYFEAPAELSPEQDRQQQLAEASKEYEVGLVPEKAILNEEFERGYEQQWGDRLRYLYDGQSLPSQEEMGVAKPGQMENYIDSNYMAQESSKPEKDTLASAYNDYTGFREIFKDKTLRKNYEKSHGGRIEQYKLDKWDELRKMQVPGKNRKIKHGYRFIANA